MVYFTLKKHPANEGPDKVGTAIILREDGNNSSFRNVVFFGNIRRWTSPKT
jgi:hypothetical protein